MGGKTLLLAGELILHPAFEYYNKIIVDADEEYAANSLFINGKVITPKGFPNTLKKLKNAGYEILQVDVSEFQKVDGGLSCLSVRY